MVRFLHTSDWQLGMTRHFLAGEAQSRYSAARTDAIRTIGRVAERERCEFVLVCGDVFESNQVSAQTVRRALDAMREVPVPVYLLPGNHDPLDASSVFTSTVFADACPEHVHVLAEPGPVPVREGLELVAAPWFSKRPLTDLVGAVLTDLVADGTTRVVVGHGALDALTPDPAGAAVIRLAAIERAVADGAIHYVALGDRHSRLSMGLGGRVQYSGSPEVTSFREEVPGDVLVVNLDTDGDPQVSSHHVGTWQFRTERHDLATRPDVENLDALLSGLPGRDRTVIRHALTGTLSLSDKAMLDAMLVRQADHLAALFPLERESDLAVMVDGAELADLGVSGFVATAAEDLVTAAQASGPDAAAAQDALSLLYRLARGGAR